MKYIRLILFPFAFVYWLIAMLRNLCFQIGVFKSSSFRTPVICVGNLSTGGTGKTPHIEYLIKLLSDSHIIATLSRGYKRKTQGFILADKTHNVADIGDEPLQFFKKFPNIYVAVDRKRVNGVKKIRQQTDAQIVLLDDAFQHRAIKAGLYILLTDYNHLFTADFMLPAGNLRESRFGANRADIVVVSKCPTTLDAEEKARIKKRIAFYTNANIVFSSIDYAPPVLMSDTSEQGLEKETHYLLLSGIANPKPLYNYLEQKGITFSPLSFPDHHDFNEQDIQKIDREFAKIDAQKKHILTTEKDAMRLYDTAEKWANHMPISYIPIQIHMNQEDGKLFQSKIYTFIRQSLGSKI